MHFQTLMRRLRSGEHPKEFGQELGMGAQRTAYKIGKYVVKEHTSSAEGYFNEYGRRSKRSPKVAFKRLGLEAPRQWFVNGWVVQPFYKPLNDDECDDYHSHYERAFNHPIYDLHCGNVGLDNQGQYVAFDW